MFMQLVTVRSGLFRLCVKIYAVFRSLCISQNVREYQVRDVFHLHNPRAVDSPLAFNLHPALDLQSAFLQF